jgi:hypothetical protein
MQVVPKTSQPHFQTSMEAAFAPWAAVEKWLRKAVEHDLPISINGLMGIEDVKDTVRDPQQIRDIINTFLAKKMVTKHELSEEQRTGDKRDRIGYKWNADFRGEPYRPSNRVLQTKAKKPSATVTTKPTPPQPAKARQEAPKAVELVFQGVTITISRNETTGNTRLVLEG